MSKGIEIINAPVGAGRYTNLRSAQRLVETGSADWVGARQLAFRNIGKAISTFEGSAFEWRGRESGRTRFQTGMRVMQIERGRPT